MSFSISIFDGTDNVRSLLVDTVRTARLGHGLEPADLDELLELSAEYPRCAEWEADHRLFTGNVYAHVQEYFRGLYGEPLICTRLIGRIRKYLEDHGRELEFALCKWEEVRAVRGLKTAQIPGDPGVLVIAPADEIGDFEPVSADSVAPMELAIYYVLVEVLQATNIVAVSD